MTFEAALDQLGVTPTTLTAAERSALDNQGYVGIANVIDRGWLEELRLGFERYCSSDSRSGTRHIEKLVELGEIFERLCIHPVLLAATYHVLRRAFRLMQLGGRDPLPGFGQQGLHADWFPRPYGSPYEIVTALWLFDDFTLKNGATRLVAATHKAGLAVPKPLADPAGHHRDEVIFTGTAGSILVFNGHLWHSGTRNAGGGSRRSAQISFVAAGNRVHGEPSPELLARVSPAARAVLAGVTI